MFSDSTELNWPLLLKDWFHVNVSVVILLLSRLYVSGIEANAFDVPQFENLKVLRIEFMRIQYIYQATFNGLTNLQVLQMDHTNLVSFEQSALATLPNLHMIRLESCGYNVLTLDNLFAWTDMKKLVKVDIRRCLLSDTINENTFSGLVHLNELNLIDNSIVKIGRKSFDVVLNTLNLLDLRSNYLKTVPRNLFNTKREVKIIVTGNPWDCSCELEDLRTYRKITNANFSKIECDSPAKYAGKEIDSCPSFCDSSSDSKEDLEVHDVDEIENEEPASIDPAIVKEDTPVIRDDNSIQREEGDFSIIKLYANNTAIELHFNLFILFGSLTIYIL